MFPMIYFCFTNNASVLNVHEILNICFEIKSVRYLLVRGSRLKKILSWFFYFNVSFAFYNPIPHLLANSYGITKWCLSFLIVEYVFKF